MGKKVHKTKTLVEVTRKVLQYRAGDVLEIDADDPKWVNQILAGNAIVLDRPAEPVVVLEAPVEEASADDDDVEFDPED